MSLTLQQAAELESTYVPSDPEVLRSLGTITLVPLVGPTAVGKNYAMQRLNYYEASGLTTRPPRLTDDLKKVRHADQEQLLKDIKEGKLVQYIVAPGSQFIYATSIDDYKKDAINTKDIVSTTVDDALRLGFKAVKPVAVVVNPADWEKRLDERFKDIDQKIIAARLDEAADSLAWILDTSESAIDRVIIIADPAHNQESLNRIRRFVENNETVPPTEECLKTAQQMLAAIPRFREKYLNNKY